MTKLLVNGRELLVKRIDQARNRDLIELQLQSGYTLREIQEKGAQSDALATVVVSFLAQHNAGFKVSWDDLLDGDFDSLGKFVTEAGDDVPKAEAEAEADPTVPASETSEAVDAESPEATAE